MEWILSRFVLFSKVILNSIQNEIGNFFLLKKCSIEPHKNKILPFTIHNYFPGGSRLDPQTNRYPYSYSLPTD